MVFLPSKLQGTQGKAIWTDILVDSDSIEIVRRPVEGEGILANHCLITVNASTQIINASFDEVCSMKCKPDEKIMVVHEEKSEPSMTLGKGGEA